MYGMYGMTTGPSIFEFIFGSVAKDDFSEDPK
jgi:hypothetical protein